MKIVKKDLLFSVLLNIIFCLFCINFYFRSSHKNDATRCIIKQSGIVIQGAKIARTIGFPTANIPYNNNSILSAVFASVVKINGKKFNAITFFNQERSILENHILDFHEDIYGKEIDVCLIKKVRDKIKFSSKEDAEKQLMQDVENAKKIFHP